jgi:hypothetical protein
MPDTIKLSKLRLNQGEIKDVPTNPRIIKDDKFERLCENIKKYPKFLEKRPIIIKSWREPYIIAGNMRFSALKEIGYKDIPKEWVKTAEDYSPEELRAFAVIDNTQYGEWDWEILANEWETGELQEWGVDCPVFDITKEFKEFDESAADDLKTVICPQCQHEFAP